MKKFIFSLLLTIGLTAVADSSIDFTEKAHDFGIIKSSAQVVTCDFTFTNNGDTPLVIVDAKADCGCTRPAIPKQPIAPGKTGKITVKFLPEGRAGEFVKAIKVTTNDPKAKKVKLKISGTIIP